METIKTSCSRSCHHSCTDSNTNKNVNTKTYPLQTKIEEWAVGADESLANQNIPATGDKLLPRKAQDGIFCLGSNNINGTNMSESGLSVATDIAVTSQYGFDMMVLQETKKPWLAANRSLYQQQCDIAWAAGGAINAFSSAPWDFDEGNYQAGGTLLSINGHNKGRFVSSGSDSLGRFTWMKLRGSNW